MTWLDRLRDEVVDLGDQLIDQVRTGNQQRLADAWAEGNKARKGSKNPYLPKEEEKK
jgi:hypothetical protein